MEYASFLQRLLGALVDAVMTFIVSLLCIKIGKSIGIGNQFYMLFDISYYVFFWYFKNATPGMMLMKIRIVSANDKQITLLRLVFRYIGIFISLAVVGIGTLWMLWDKRSQTWQDKIAKTVVVKI